MKEDMICSSLVWIVFSLCNLISAVENSAPVSAGDCSESMKVHEIGDVGKSQNLCVFARKVEKLEAW